jgi:hypothetical protein
MRERKTRFATPQAYLAREGGRRSSEPRRRTLPRPCQTPSEGGKPGGRALISMVHICTQATKHPFPWHKNPVLSSVLDEPLTASDQPANIEPKQPIGAMKH